MRKSLKSVRYSVPIKTLLALTLTVPASADVLANNESSTSLSTQQNQSVQGRIVDEYGEPLIGVTVRALNGNKATVTDLDGKYTLQIPRGAKVKLSYTGYKDKVITAGGNAAMEPDVLGLDDVVVIGYGQQKKRDLTGAITTVNGADLTLNPGSNPMEALQGKVAGLDITRTSGAAGEGVNMQLRGTRSFTASGTPTFIIDGMPGDYTKLNPNDIESIEVLKDASSTAVYGASGANGVVLITTKSGKAGKTKVDFNAYLGVNGWSSLPEMRSGESYLQGIRDAQQAVGNWNSTADDETVFNNVLGDGAWNYHKNGQYINWADELLKTGFTQNYSASISGGTERTQSYFSLNYSDEKGQYENDNNKIYSSNVRVKHKIKDWLSVGINSQMSYTYRNRAFSDLETALRMEPLGTVYDEAGEVKVNPTLTSSNYNLLLNNYSNYRNNNQGFNLYFNPYIEINPVKGLTILSRVSANIGYSRTNYFQGINSYRFYNSGGQTDITDDNVIARVTQSHTYNYKWENVITYNFKIADDHDFTLTGVSSWNHNQNEATMQQETGITDNAYLWHNMGLNGSSKSTITSGYTMSKSLGFVGRLAYSYQGKYLASVSVRHDGSSRLSEEKRWDTFPAFSLGWRISDENFMKNTRSWLDNLKVRFGWGVTGTASINPYSTVSNLEQSTLAFSGNTETIYRFSQEYTNKNLGWEKSYNTNIGVDATFLNGRIDFTADYYWTKTNGVIWTRELPITDGGYNSTTYYTMAQNICETKNNGIELALTTRNIKTRDFSWDSNITFSANHEEITALTGNTANNITNGQYTLTIGEPVNSFYNYKLDGVWQKGEEADAAVFGMQPGDLKINVPGLIHESEGVYYKIDEETGEKVYYNADNHYTVSSADYQTLGHASPDWTLGFKNTLRYKNFDLSIFMYWRYGQTMYYSLLSDYDPTGVRNFPTYFDYWTESNPSNYFPAINASRSIDSYTGYYSLGYVDGSYFKVKNITLGYTLPKSTLAKLGLSNCRVYGTITNPLVIAKSSLVKDYDPEMGGSLNYPLTRQLVFGINLTF